MHKRYLYPLKFDTQYMEKIWGGHKIQTHLGKDIGALANCGETWEISGVKGHLSRVAEGVLKGSTLPELMEEFGSDLVGQQVADQYGTEFPLLVKFIDAAEDLSIQVHPDDELAKKRHGSLGKSEMWYIFQADEGAKLITGFNRDTNQEEYLDHLGKGRLTELLNEEEVQAGDCFYLPAGRVHTIGKGLLLAEIQQSSDVTYRIYDFDRKDAAGNKRDLHTEEALEALDFRSQKEFKTRYNHCMNEVVPLVQSEYFQTNLLEYSTGAIREHYECNSFVIYTCFEGEAEIIAEGHLTTIRRGEAVLLPQKFKQVHLKSKLGFKMLETYIP